MNGSLSNSDPRAEFQLAREYARQGSPRLLPLSARLARAVPAEELASYASAIAEESCAAHTIHAVVRALALDDEAAVRTLAAQVLQHCPPDDQELVGLAQWLATDGDQTVAGAAFRALGGWFKPGHPLHGVALDMRHSEFARVRLAAVRILSQATADPSAVKALAQALQDTNWRVQKGAAQALAQVNDPRVVDVLAHSLQHTDWSVRQSAAKALGQLGDPRGIEALIHDLQKGHLWVRARAAEALGEMGDSSAVNVLVRGLQDADEWVRQRAAEALGQMSDPRAVQVLLLALRHRNPLVQQNAARALGRLGDASALEPLLEVLRNHRNPTVQQNAARALGRLGDASAVELLLQVLRNQKGEVQRSAGQALAQISDARAVGALLGLLWDEDSDVRRTAAEALGQVNDARAVPALLQALRDKTWWVRRGVCEALGQQGDTRAIEPLLQVLQRERPGVQQSAARALGRLGRGDEQLFTRFQELAARPKPDLRYAACLALKGLLAIAPEKVFLIAEHNLHQSAPNLEHRRLFLEIIGRCAFSGVQPANITILAWSRSRKSSERVAAAALLGELLPLQPTEALEALANLAHDEDWTVREATAAALVGRSLFHTEIPVKVLQTLGEEEELAVAVAASASLELLTGDHIESPRLQRYRQDTQLRGFLDWSLYQRQRPHTLGFAPFMKTTRSFHPMTLEKLSMQPVSSYRQEEIQGYLRQGERSMPHPDRQGVRREELRRLLRELSWEFSKPIGPPQLECLEQLLGLWPEPLVFYTLYKHAPDEISGTAYRLFYELASLVEQVEFLRGGTLRSGGLPTMLEQIARGFRELQQFPQTQAYAALLGSIHRMLTVASLSEILTSLAVSENELLPFVGEQSKPFGAAGLGVWLSHLQEAISPLRQYSESAPLALRTVPLSETLAQLEKAELVNGLERVEPYRVFLLEILAHWRALLRLEIRRLEGEARLEFSTVEKVTMGGTITLVLEILNRGPGPASNLQVQLTGTELENVVPHFHTLPSLAVNDTRVLSFTGRTQAERITAEFAVTYDDLLAKAHEQRYSATVAVRAAAQVWQYIRNPYLPGKPDPDLRAVERLFVGREDVLHFIEENLVGADAERIVVLYGHRRTGKTWTLLRLQERLPNTYLPVYIDVQEFTGVNGVPPVLQIFADEILRTVAERCVPDRALLTSIHVPTLEQYKENYPYYFKRVFLRDVEQVLGARKLLWLFDEFQGLDDMVISGSLPATFMEFLRDLMQFGKKMAFIFAGTREMTGQYWSIFFNIAVHRKIGVFNDAEAEKLIVAPVRPLGVEHDRFAVPLVKQLTGNHPYFIQLLCDKIVSELNARRQMLVNAQIIEAAVDDLVINGASNLKFYWVEVMDEQERAIAGTMQGLLRRRRPADVSTLWSEMSQINPRVTPPAVSSTLKTLTEKDLLEKDRTTLDTYQFKIGLVERYIGAHVPYTETQERIGKVW